MDAANHLADFGVGGGGHRARIQNGNLALLRGWRFFEACVQELPLERGAICLACATAEIEQVKRGHIEIPNTLA
jgi:hypothetical protein